MEGLPGGWEEHFDDATGAVFYHHPATQVTQWECPVPLQQPSTGAPSLSHEEVLSQALDQIFVNDGGGSRGKQSSKYALQPLSSCGMFTGQQGHPTRSQPLAQPQQHAQPHHSNEVHHQQQYQQQQQSHQHQQYQQYQQPQQQQHYQYPQQQPHQQQTQTQTPVPRRTMVKIKSKKHFDVLKGSSKVHVQEEPLPMATASTATTAGRDFKAKKTKSQSSTVATSCAIASSEHSTPTGTDTGTGTDIGSVMPVGGKSQDYLGLVQIYNLQRPFLDRQHNIPCVLCQRVVPEDIFFPCEHKVVCRSCLQKEQVCPDYDLAKFPNGHCNCPLCAAIIKLILPNEGGREVEKYWSWVLAVKPELPQGFLRDFRHSAAIIQKIHIDENAKIRGRKASQCCAVS